MSGTEIVRRSSASIPDKITYARALAEASLLPTAYRGKPANVLLAVEMGEALGLHPFVAIQSVYVVEGKPAASAGLISALVRRAGHRLRVSGDNDKAVAEIIRVDDPEFTYRAEWTIDRAVDAGLVQRRDGKLWARDDKGRPMPWERYPAAMLKARAITEVARDACQEALSGVQYTPEELGAAIDTDGQVIDLQPVEHTAASPDPEAVAAVLAEAAAAGATEDTARAHARDQHAGVELEDLDRDQLRAEWTRWHTLAAQASSTPASQSDPAATSVPAEAASEPHSDAQRHEPEPVTQAQLAKLHALLNAGRVTDRTAKLRIASALAGRELTSTSQLTKTEAVSVIDTLEAILTGPDPAATLAGIAIDDTHDQDQEAQAQ